MIFPKHSHCLLALALSGLVAAGPAAAAKSNTKADATPAGQTAAAAPGGQANYGVKLGAFFKEEHRKAARSYFSQRYAKGKECPPGMERGAKGCAPPVEGRYWAVGQTLQPGVKAHALPESAKSKLPPEPDGYEYVMAGEDILLVSKGLHLVVDMIQDVMG